MSMKCLMKPHIYYAAVLSALFLLAACGSGSVDVLPEEPEPEWQSGLDIPDNRYVEHYRILLMGNSHVHGNNLGGIIVQMIQTGRQGIVAEASLAGDSLFLDERMRDDSSLTMLQSQPWTHVILQGQKYSMSGTVDYPIDASLYWIQAVKHYKATPLMFPEHPRAGQPEEANQIQSIHLDIARREKTCVAPVGLAFDLMQELAPEVRLHHQDGNHTSLNGTFLTALVFYQSITGLNADSLPDLPGLGIASELQQLMGQVASATLAQHPACVF